MSTRLAESVVVVGLLPVDELVILNSLSNEEVDMRSEIIMKFIASQTTRKLILCYA